MKSIRKVLAAAVVPAFLISTAPGVWAQHDDHHDDQHKDSHGAPAHENHPPTASHNFVRHDDWQKGRRMNTNDWSRGRKLDYHAYHLAPPPHGYEWREVDGNYVMAAVATGLIAAAIVAAATH